MVSYGAWWSGGLGLSLEGVAWAWVGVMGNHWRDLDQIWAGGSLHPQEGYGLCGYVLGVAWAWEKWFRQVTKQLERLVFLSVLLVIVQNILAWIL